jgi:hypothetical protein
MQRLTILILASFILLGCSPSLIRRDLFSKRERFRILQSTGLGVSLTEKRGVAWFKHSDGEFLELDTQNRIARIIYMSPGSSIHVTEGAINSDRVTNYSFKANGSLLEKRTTVGLLMTLDSLGKPRVQRSKVAYLTGVYIGIDSLGQPFTIKNVERQRPLPLSAVLDIVHSKYPNTTSYSLFGNLQEWLVVRSESGRSYWTRIDGRTGKVITNLEPTYEE